MCLGKAVLSTKAHYNPKAAIGHPETTCTHPFVSGCASVCRRGRGFGKGDPNLAGQLYSAQASLR